MDWLAQHWAWIVLVVGLGFFFFRGGLGGFANGMGTHGHARGSEQSGAGGPGYGEGGGSGPTVSALEAVVDPVSGELVGAAQALTSLYQWKIYYFASKENRERFEAAPQKYVQNTAGYPVQPVAAPQSRPAKRRGCC